MAEKESQIAQCAQCGTRNRIPLDKINLKAKCGKCGSSLRKETGGDDRAGYYRFRCTECGAKNRIPSDKVNAGAICGNCKKSLKTEELFGPQPVTISEANFKDKVLGSPLPVLLFAWAPWCSTCRAFIPIIDDFAKYSEGKIRVGKMDVDQNPNLSSKYSILGVPQIFVFDYGDLKGSFSGAIQKNELMTKMAEYL